MNSQPASVPTALTLILGGTVGMHAASHVVPAKDAGSSPEVKSHMGRDVGLAWLELPLVPPQG